MRDEGLVPSNATDFGWLQKNSTSDVLRNKFVTSTCNSRILRKYFFIKNKKTGSIFIQINVVRFS